MKVKVDIAILIDESGKIAKCFRLIMDDNFITCEDTQISEFLSISLDQYKQRIKNICATYEDNYGLWIDDNNLSDENAIKKFKEEFFTELMLLKITGNVQ